MAIIKKPYEISVWDEKLGENGQKTEIKRAIIGAHDMSYLGRATSPKLTKNLNGTHILTFQMPSKFFDSEKGEYIHNEFCDNIFNERKVKLKYDDEWYEFYVKNITENKQFKSIMYQYTCEDAFIDELSRNGYGITFDTELYNNVEEIGTFTEIILDDSIWEYDASKNWGDFTEYAEEKLFKIPVSMFRSVPGYKINYIVDGTLTNVFSGETRKQEIGDDLSREQKIFWDNGDFDNGIPLLQQQIKNVDNDGYIYVPYSCLDFCYINTGDSNYAATQEAAEGEINGIKSYYLAPNSIDPTSLIQFIAIPTGAEVQIDEAGLLVNKDYSYVMTLKDWNECVNSNKWYNTEANVIQDKTDVAANKIVCYDGYLEQIGDVELTFGKKISLTDRTEINISEDIDQYVEVYNNTTEDFINKKNNSTEFTSDEWDSSEDGTINYRICSSENTRTIVPQLARNLVQNGTEMTDTSGWEVMKLFTGVDTKSSSISVKVEVKNNTEDDTSDVETPQGLILDNHTSAVKNEDLTPYRTFINFGIVGQEEIISKDQTYVLHIDSEYVERTGDSKNGYVYTTYSDASKVLIPIVIGEGGYDADGDYTINKEQAMSLRVKPGVYYFIRPTKKIENPYFAIRPLTIENKDREIVFNLKKAIFSKAYTKGKDFFNDEKVRYKYTGRDIFFSPKSWTSGENMYYREADELEFLREEDIVEGDAYTYKKYFRQQLQAKNGKTTELKDSFMLKSYLKNDVEINGFDPTIYTEDDIKVITDYIDLNRCRYYNSNATVEESDCKHQDSSNGVCMYQKYGYCPYRFQTQKHCRKIRTLNGEKSNRFNLTQELSKVFEIYPIYYTEHEENGKIKVDIVEEDNKIYEKMRKKVFYITEKGVENKLGFRYTKNLSNISRTFDSKEIVTKLYVEDVDSELSKTGLCSIKTAEDNPSRDNYIIDFSYYTMRGLLDRATTEADLYGKNKSDMGYLKQLGYYNKKYDELSNLIINLQDESYTEMTANVEVNLTGIETAQKELNKINKNLSRYSAKKSNGLDKTAKESDTYLNYKAKYNEQKNILLGLIEDTFMTDGKFYRNLPIESDKFKWSQMSSANELLDAIMSYGFKSFKKEFLDTFLYRECGLMGQYTEEYLQIQSWKKQRAKYLKDINRISLQFYKKYEPYLKEGTWSDSNYLSDNSYYFGAKEVAKQGAIPKLTYNISVIDLSILDSDYKIDVADTTYIEDIETFGINKKTGLPNKLKVIISGITYSLDTPTENSIQVQNYTTQFEDLFQQISASVQSLSFNENIYKRSSNFTSTQNISEESLQGGLSENQLTLIETDEKNIELDNTGQSGSDINNHANKYKLSGEGLFFSNNGGQTWNVGVTPKGINADYIKVGSLDASKISIVDGEYLYFLWDKGGITAYRTPQATAADKNYFQDFARFNKYGLSLVEGGKIRLRAGYEYIYKNGEGEKGDITSEDDIRENTKIGFYLYNDSGQKIFATNSSDTKESARLSLRGEIYVTDTNLQYTDTVSKKAKYSHLISFEDRTIKVYSDDAAITPMSDSEFSFNDFSEKWETEHHAEAIKYLQQYGLSLLLKDNNFSTKQESNDDFTIILTLNKNKSISLIEKYLSIDSKNYSLFSSFNIIDYDITDKRPKKEGEKEEDKKAVGDMRFLFIKEKFPQKAWDATIYRLKTIKQFVKENKNATEEDKDYFAEIQNIFYWEESSQNNLIEKNMELYKMTNNMYYKNVTYTEEETTEASNGESVLYINNPSLAGKSEERLFCCATQKTVDDVIKKTNIFTILKNGRMFIGGEVVNKDGSEITGNISELPAEISVKDSGIEITSKGELFINFNKLATTNDEGETITLVDYVAGEIQKQGSVLTIHKHDIKTINYSYTGSISENTVGIPIIGKDSLIVPNTSPSGDDNKVTWTALKELFNTGKGPSGEHFSLIIKGQLIDTDSGKNCARFECVDTTTENAGSQSSGGSTYSLPDPIDTNPGSD